MLLFSPGSAYRGYQTATSQINRPNQLPKSLEEGGQSLVVPPFADGLSLIARSLFDWLKV
ncbi:MAG: hypothetical protein AAF716_22840 [Cyanobacteria bacterium P01_D01_bin.1]